MMTEDELREAVRFNFKSRALKEGQFCAAHDVALEFLDVGMEEELLLAIINDELSRHRILH